MADMCMKFYDDAKLLYLETDATGVGLGVALLQMDKGTACQKDIVPDNTQSAPHCICQQTPNRCRVQVQQHRQGGPRYSI